MLHKNLKVLRSTETSSKVMKNSVGDKDAKVDWTLVLRMYAAGVI